MITEDDFEHQVAEMLERRALDIEDTGTPAIQVLPVPSESGPSTSSPRPARDRIRVMVAALALAIGGTAAFVASRGNSAEVVATGTSDEVESNITFGNRVWNLAIPSADLFPADFSLNTDLPLFSAEGDAAKVIDAYFNNRLADRSINISSELAEVSSNALTALHRWTWTGDPVGDASPSGWLYLRFGDGAWNIYAVTTDGVDMSDLRFTPDGFEVRITSDSIQSMTAEWRLASMPVSVEGFLASDSYGPLTDTLSSISDNGVIALSWTCADLIQVNASLRDRSGPVSISEHVVLNARADRLDCKPPTFDDLRDQDRGPATTEGRSAFAEDWPMPRLTIDTSQLDELVIFDAHSSLIDLGSPPERFYHQTFRVPGDEFDGRMVFVGSATNDVLDLAANVDVTQGTESVKVDGTDLYIVEQSSNVAFLIGTDPNNGSVTIRGIGMDTSELVEFAQSLSTPESGRRAWRLTEPGDGLIQVFEGYRYPIESDLLLAVQSALWSSGNGNGFVSLELDSGGATSFELALDGAAFGLAQTGFVREIIAGRTVFITSQNGTDVAIWREDEITTAQLVVSKETGASIRQVLQQIDVVAADTWVELEQRAAENAATALPPTSVDPDSIAP